MATLATLEDQVRVKMNLSASDTSPLSDAMINQFILDAQNEIVSLMPDDALYNLVELSQSNPGSTGSTSVVSIPSDAFRILSVRFKEASGSLTYAQKITPQVMDKVLSETSSFPSVNGKYYAIKDGSILLSQACVNESNSAEVSYIKLPQTTTGTECDLPEWLQPLMVDYAVAQAKKQIEEYQVAQLIMNDFYQRLGALSQRYAGIHKL